MMNYFIILTFILSVVFSIKFASDISNSSNTIYFVKHASFQNYNSIITHCAKRRSFFPKKMFMGMTLVYSALLLI